MTHDSRSHKLIDNVLNFKRKDIDVKKTSVIERVKSLLVQAEAREIDGMYCVTVHDLGARDEEYTTRIFADVNLIAYAAAVANARLTRFLDDDS